MPIPWLNQKGKRKSRRPPAELKLLAEARLASQEAREKARQAKIEAHIMEKYPDIFEKALLASIIRKYGGQGKQDEMTVPQLLEAAKVFTEIDKAAARGRSGKDSSILETILNSDAVSTFMGSIGQVAGAKMVPVVQAQQQVQQAQPEPMPQPAALPQPEPEPQRSTENQTMAMPISMNGKLKLMEIVGGGNKLPKPPREAAAMFLTLAHDEPAIERMVADLPRIPEQNLIPYLNQVLSMNADLRNVGLGPWLSAHWDWFLAVVRELREQTNADGAESFTTHRVGLSGL